jgi:CheY-like chemotaxis protein
MNLAVNARDAMSQGGRLTIETGNVDVDGTFARCHFAVAPGRYVTLSVTDTGCGMDAETKAHMFEPFFTTKEQGKGTGLGLATVYGIVKQSGGYIGVDSEQGRGTTFTVYLPCVDHASQGTKPAETRARVAQGSETVLVVEDENAVRSLVRGVLESNGYSVLEARHGGDALSLCDLHKGSIHLLLTDVVMPQMSGRELAEYLSPLRRGMKVLYMSGYTDDALGEHRVLDPSVPFIKKPFTPDALARKVREVLDGRREREFH